MVFHLFGADDKTETFPSVCRAFKHRATSSLSSFFPVASSRLSSSPSFLHTMHKRSQFKLTLMRSDMYTKYQALSIFLACIVFPHGQTRLQELCLLLRKSFHVRSARKKGKTERAEEGARDVNSVHRRQQQVEGNDKSLSLSLWTVSGSPQPSFLNVPQCYFTHTFLFFSMCYSVLLYLPFHSPQHPEIAQSEDDESCYLSLPPCPRSTSAIPLTIVWQSEQSEGNKGAGQLFKEERMSTVSPGCDVGISASHQTSILREKRKPKKKEGGCVFSQKEQKGGKKKKKKGQHEVAC